MKALAWKELREVFGITAIALVCYLALAINAMGGKVFDCVPRMPRGTTGVPFHDGGFADFHYLLSVILAMALGFRQSAWESARGTYLFLLHRSLRRETFFLTKLAQERPSSYSAPVCRSCSTPGGQSYRDIMRGRLSGR